MLDDVPLLKIVFLGESGTGKTSIITRYVDKAFSATNSPTIGCFGRNIPFTFNDRPLSLNIWDTAGQEIYRSLTPMYYRNAAAAVIVFDVANRTSFEQVQGWINELTSNINNIVLVICGNKIDLAKRRVVEDYEAQAIAGAANSIYIETSALTGAGLDFLFQTVVQHAIEARPGIFMNSAKSGPSELEPPEPSALCC